MSDPSKPTPAYKSTLTRRQTLKWMGVMSASMALPAISGCDSVAISAAKLAGRWPDLELDPITGEGYGKDPNLISPPQAPWPLTMSQDQRNLTATLCDILIPREGDVPSASEVGVPDAIDEWISAPYPSHHSDRKEILSGLAWIDEESQRRFDKKFVAASATIDGDTIVVSSPKVAKPVAVRFGWEDTAEPNLINSAGLPASPFRTDNFELLSKDVDF